MIFKEEKAFTLVEVVASIVIITLVILSFAQIFIQTNKTAKYNNERLITINLADAALAKVKAQPMKKQPTYHPNNLKDYFKDPTVQTAISLNNKTYNVAYTPSQEKGAHPNAYNSEENLNLIKVVVTVTSPDNITKGSSEGYVYIE